MERRLRETLKGGKFENVPIDRSLQMGVIRGRGNKTTEARLRLMLVRSGISGWKMHPPGMAGNPDFYFPASQIAIFADGCFWHGCPKCGHVPSTNRRFWGLKIQRNKERDAQKARRLKSQGIIVLRFWEHELKHDGRQCIAKLEKLLAKSLSS